MGGFEFFRGNGFGPKQLAADAIISPAIQLLLLESSEKKFVTPD
jgi:hypothetical protein